jgi:putative addiction module killer protein
MVTFVIPSIVVTVLEYVDGNGRSPFRRWFESLNTPAVSRVITALTRIGEGNFSNVKAVGGAIFEYRIDFGPGYRIYFGRDGDTVVIVLAGGTKKRQQDDIHTAQERWADYKRRKARGG